MLVICLSVCLTICSISYEVGGEEELICLITGNSCLHFGSGQLVTQNWEFCTAPIFVFACMSRAEIAKMFTDLGVLKAYQVMSQDGKCVLQMTRNWGHLNLNLLYFMEFSGERFS